MTDEKLIKEFWISHRAKKLANEVADPELNPVGHWAAFEEATLSADLEWFANYEGLPAAELENWHSDESRSSRFRIGADAKASTAESKSGRKIRCHLVGPCLRFVLISRKNIDKH